MNFKTYLSASASEINNKAQSFLANWFRNSNQEIAGQLRQIFKLFIESSGGGKVLRGTLVKLGYELTGAPPTQEIVKPAIAFELLHTALLIQDDIIDQSPLRRGKLTLYRSLGGNHYAISQAFFLGNMGYFLANKLIAECNFSEKQKVHAISVFSQTVMDTIIGEMLDVKLSLPKEKKLEHEVLSIHRLKAASYTIVGPLAVGAIFGGADKKTLSAIKQFGEHIGIAFQIQDDILGVFGDEKTIGKSVSSDIEENKNTLLIAYALKNATIKQKEILTLYYGKKNSTNKELHAIRQVFVDTGSLAYSQEKAKYYVVLGKKIIPQLTNDKKMQNILTEFADFIVKRQK